MICFVTLLLIQTEKIHLENMLHTSLYITPVFTIMDIKLKWKWSLKKMEVKTTNFLGK